MRPAVPLADLTEKEWQAQVVDIAKQLGWHRPYHTHDSRRSEPGWPDLALVRDRFVLLELKREKTKATEAQREWIRRLLAAGVETYIVRPRDLHDLVVVLMARKRYGDFASDRHGEAARVAANGLHERTREEIA